MRDQHDVSRYTIYDMRLCALFLTLLLRRGLWGVASKRFLKVILKCLYVHRFLRHTNYIMVIGIYRNTHHNQYQPPAPPNAMLSTTFPKKQIPSSSKFLAVSQLE